jgi:hypothetical protein
LSDIFIGICSSLKNAKYSNEVEDKYKPDKITKKECLDAKEIYINEDNIKIEDEFIKCLGVIDIRFTEFAPKVFQKLRQIEKLDEDELIE